MTHYEVLGVEPAAAAAEVRSAYVALAREHHPDVAGGDAERMRAINEAWAVLGDPRRRADYDRSLEPGRFVAPAAEERHRERTDEEELLADLADDTPLGGRVVLPRWLSMLPAAAFGAAVLAFAAALVVSSAAALAASVALLLLSGTLFLAAPFVALLASRRGG